MRLSCTYNETILFHKIYQQTLLKEVQVSASPGINYFNKIPLEILEIILGFANTSSSKFVCKQWCVAVTNLEKKFLNKIKPIISSSIFKDFYLSCPFYSELKINLEELKETQKLAVFKKFSYHHVASTERICHNLIDDKNYRLRVGGAIQNLRNEISNKIHSDKLVNIISITDQIGFFYLCYQIYQSREALEKTHFIPTKPYPDTSIDFMSASQQLKDVLINATDTNDVTEVTYKEKVQAYIPNSITFFKNINVLNLSQINLSYLPSGLESLIHLEKLDLSKNEFTHIPCMNLLELKELNLDSNQFTNTPCIDLNAPALNSFSINDNKITDLHPSLKRFSTLFTLSLRSTNVRNFPSFIFTLTNLKVLKISSRNLKAIPKGICVLTQLEELHISSNKSKFLPSELTLLKNLKISNL